MQTKTSPAVSYTLHTFTIQPTFSYIFTAYFFLHILHKQNER